MNIRPARIGDGLAAIGLMQELVGPEVKVADGPLGAKRWAAVVTHSGTTVFVADLPGTGVVGMATLHVLPNISFAGQSYALVENVVVTTAHRGKGTGRMLMEAAIREAWRADCHHIMLLTGHDMKARGFYEKLGFSADSRDGMILHKG
ncbi:MAG: GNAT family N-acetyltransferase [Pseudomonadota bacterium]